MRTSPPSTLRAIALRLGVLGLLLTVAVSLRAGSPLDAGTDRWRLDRIIEQSSVAVRVLLLVWALVLVGLLVWTMASRQGQPGRRPRRRSVWASLAVFFGFAVAAVSLDRLRRDRVLPPEVRSPDVASPPSSAGDRVVPEGHPSLLLLVALALLVVVAVTLAARRRRALPVQEADESSLQVGLEAAARVLRERSADEPRERVLAAYEAFEQALADRGLQRGVSGTPTALLARAVDDGAPPAAAAELTELFGSARFGAEPVTEHDVVRAERALGDLMATR